MHCLYKHVSSFVFALATVARCALEQVHSSYDVSCCLTGQIDDSQADVLSEGSWQDQVPSPGQESYYEPEEMEVRVSAALPAADAPEFIEVPATGEAEADVPEGYFQRRWHGKQSIKRQIRKFLITGWCKWRGKRIESRAELAHTFDQQIISEMERTVKLDKADTTCGIGQKLKDWRHGASQVCTLQPWIGARREAAGDHSAVPLV